MWFKNLAIFRFTEPFGLSSLDLEQKLAQLPFRPCAAQQESSIGWIAPLGRNALQLVHSANGYMMLCTQKEEKVLPATVVNEVVLERIQEQEDREARKLAKKERTAIKDEVIFELLPKAFSFSRKTYAYIDPQGGWLIVDAASAKKAEELVSLLRKCVGSLPLILPTTREKPSVTMTQWLLDNATPSDIVIEDECELRSQEEEGGIIRCKRHDLTLPEIKNHLDNGKQAIKLALTWADRLSFVIDEHLAIKRLRFLDLIQDQVQDTDSGDAADLFDTEFSIMSLELAGFLPRLLELFGGENQSS
ncbi:MAG: recombination-associated protein RdgC [Gammaproteobacteria bacterium]